MSDHKIIELNIQLQSNKRGPGMWKLNSSVIKEPKYNKYIRNLIDTEWDTSDIADLGTRFYWLKYRIMQYSIKYCKDRAKFKRNREQELTNNIKEIDAKICDELATTKEIQLYNEYKSELENIFLDKTRGIWIRSRLEYIENDEKSNSYFFNKSKHIYIKKRQ